MPASLLASAPRPRSIQGLGESLEGEFVNNIKRATGAAWLALWSGAAAAQDSLSDPAGSGVIVAAVRWLEGTLLGTIATVVAVIAVASVGFLMLTGRINWRYGATVILGCFILFGAASIVAGIQSTASLGN
jgi:type IV secretion system protein VirB2